MSHVTACHDEGGGNFHWQRVAKSRPQPTVAVASSVHTWREPEPGIFHSVHNNMETSVGTIIFLNFYIPNTKYSLFSILLPYVVVVDHELGYLPLPLVQIKVPKVGGPLLSPAVARVWVPGVGVGVTGQSVQLRLQPAERVRVVDVRAVRARVPRVVRQQHAHAALVKALDRTLEASKAEAGKTGRKRKAPEARRSTPTRARPALALALAVAAVTAPATPSAGRMTGGSEEDDAGAAALELRTEATNIGV